MGFNISIKIMNIAVGTHIANEINTCLMVDTPKNDLAQGPFLRIWVDIDITKLLFEEKWFILKMYKKGGSFSNTRGYLSFAIIVVYLVTKIVNVKKLEKLVFHQMMMIFNLVHDFVLWLQNLVTTRVILANPNQERKTMMEYMCSRMMKAKPSPLHQLTAPWLVGKSNKMAVRYLLDGPTRIFVKWENLKSSDP